MNPDEFDNAQTDADTAPQSSVDANTAGCCGPCDPCEAYTFKQSTNTRRLVATSIDTPIKQAWRRYQDYKCGGLEYNIYDSSTLSVWVAERTMGRTMALADGFAPDPPPRAKRPFNNGCCLLEAKWSQPDRRKALYVGQSTFVRNARHKFWLVAAHRKATRFSLTPAGRRMTLRAFAAVRWTQKRADALLQVAIYNGFCGSSSTPYTEFLVICGEKPFVAVYHRSLIRGLSNGRVVHSSFRDGHHWKTSGRPRGC